MIAALLWRYRAILAVGALILSALVWHRVEVSAAASRGYASAITWITGANQAARDKADAGERKLGDCPAGQWNRQSGKCER